MSCKSLILTANTTATTVPVGSAVPVGSIIRRYGNSLLANGSTINVRESGYYDVDFNATFGGTAGIATFTVYVNGVAIPGATASETISTANTERRSVAINTVVRVYCCAGANISVLVDSASTSTPNVQSSALRVVRV